MQRYWPLWIWPEKKLGCSFSGMDGRDIAEDIQDNFVNQPPGSQPSSYR